MQRVPLHSVAQARRIDRLAGEQYGLAGPELMARAGAAAFRCLRDRWPAAVALCVVCGSGNNGGDGLVLARLALEAGLRVQVFLAGRGPHEGSEAAGALDRWLAAGGEISPVPQTLPPADVYVDALLGIGLRSAPEGEVADAIAALLQAGPVLALDVPSGMDADTGDCPGKVVQAKQTISFIVRKFGLHTGRARESVGEVLLETLDLPDELLQQERPVAWLASGHPVLGVRPADAHKGHYGHVLVIGGAPGFSGAARMAGEAALRVGAGLVSVATHPSHATTLNAGRWELMVHGIGHGDELEGLLNSASVVALGPGLSQTAWGQAIWQAALAVEGPLVVDADALNLLAGTSRHSDAWILTPHPGEAARLLGCSVAEVQSDRREAVQRIAQRYGGVVILKGAGTLVQSGEGLMVCDAGNPGMASGGMGDVLTGVIAGLLAQGRTLSQAACEGVCLHATAGDHAAMAGQRGLLSTDLMPWLRRLVNGMDT